MNIGSIAYRTGFVLILSSARLLAPAEEFTNAIQSFLQQRVAFEKRDAGLVVGVVNEHGSSTVSCGKLDNGTGQEINGDTLFEIGSITKTFTALLLQDMIERREMNLGDPVAKYLPESVQMPARYGKQITLLQLATHTSGLPRNPDNAAAKRADHPLENFTVEVLYPFLSNYQLTRDPGAKFEYSNLGIGLLGEAIALKAGTNYEALVLDRICKPLKLDSTRITLPAEFALRFAQGHNGLGYAVPSTEFQTLKGCGALRSSAEDLLKYISANLGLTASDLTPLMQKTHVVRFQSALQTARFGGSIGLAWFVAVDPQGREIVWHSGGTSGFNTFVGFDKTRRRGVVVLSNSRDSDIDLIGMLLLESEWRSDRRPTATKVSSRVFESYVGQYQLAPNFALGMWILRQIVSRAPKAMIYLPAAVCLAVMGLVLWRTASARKRWIILGCAALAGASLAIISALVASQVACALLHPGIGIRPSEERLLAQGTFRLSRVLAKYLPPGAGQIQHRVTGELVPVSEDQWFERLTGIPITVSRYARGRVARLTAHFLGGKFSFRKVSDQPPGVVGAAKLRSEIQLDTKLLDACVGQYEIPPQPVWPTAGLKITIAREGNQLVLHALGKDITPLPIEIYPESETNFFLKINDEQLTFIKNDQGEVTALIHHMKGLPDCEGKKLVFPAR